MAIANENAPDQTIVGGLPRHRRFRRTAESTRLGGAPAECAGSISHAGDAPVKQPLEAALRGETLSRPHTLFLSSVTNQYTVDPRQIKLNLIEQMTQPVRYVDLVQRLVAEEAEILLEVGPGQILTRLNGKILNSSGTLLLAADDARQASADSLLRLQARLEVLGAVDRADERSPATHSGAIDGKPPVAHYDATAIRRERCAPWQPQARVRLGPPSKQATGSTTPGPSRRNSRRSHRHRKRRPRESRRSPVRRQFHRPVTRHKPPRRRSHLQSPL